MKTIPVSTVIVVNYAMKWGSPFEFNKKSMETETMIRISHRGKVIVEQIQGQKK